MVAQVVTARLPWWSLAIAAITISAPGAPKVTVESESGSPLFGELLSADGDLLVAADRSQADSWAPVTRIVRVHKGRVVEEARVEYARFERISGLDVSAGRVAVKLNEKQVVEFYERGRAWKKADTLKLEGGCQFTGRWIDLANDVLVVHGEDAICVYEKRASWTLVAKLPFANHGDWPVTNGDRIVQQAYKPAEVARLTRRRAGKWTREGEIKADGDRAISAIAISERWLALATMEGWANYAIEMYELGAKPTRVATLKSAGDAMYKVALSNDTLITSGSADHQVFRFDGTTWRAAGTLPRTGRWDTVSVGSLAWVGRYGGDDDGPGVIDGFGLD